MYNRPNDTGSAPKLPIDQDAWMLFRFDNLEVIRLHLAPGTSIDNHPNDWRIVFHVLRGEGVLNVEGSIHALGEQQSIAVEAGKERFWRNEGLQDLELLVIKTKGEE
jgi:quercetin dioxygenase-like cupin family protein